MKEVSTIEKLLLWMKKSTTYRDSAENYAIGVRLI